MLEELLPQAWQQGQHTQWGLFVLRQLGVRVIATSASF